MGEACNFTGVASNGDVVADHLDSCASCYGLAEISNGYLGGERLLFLSIVCLPLGVVVHHWEVAARKEEEDDEKGEDQLEIRNYTIAESAHGIFTFVEVEVEEWLTLERTIRKDY